MSADDEKYSRRAWLKIALLTAGVATPPLLRPATAADTKAAKSVVHYRDHPNQMRMCGMCKFFESREMDGGMMGGGMMAGGMMGGGPMGGGMMGRGMMAGECQVVEGRISPMGWCDLYASRRA